MKIPNRPLRFYAQQMAGLLPEDGQVFSFGIEDPFADDPMISVEGFIDGVETQIGHAHGVAIRKSQGYAQFPAPVFKNCPPLFGQPSLLPFFQFPQHAKARAQYLKYLVV